MSKLPILIPAGADVRLVDERIVVTLADGTEHETAEFPRAKVGPGGVGILP